jgi:hypothetical protein
MSWAAESMSYRLERAAMRAGEDAWVWRGIRRVQGVGEVVVKGKTWWVWLKPSGWAEVRIVRRMVRTAGCDGPRSFATAGGLGL